MKLAQIFRWSLLPVLAVVVAGSLTVISAPAETTPDTVRVEIIGGEAKSEDAQKVMSVFQKLLQGLGQRSLAVIGQCLSEDVFIIDSKSHNTVSGKQAVLDHIGKQLHGKDEAAVVKSIVVYDPFVDVHGDTAMVSFKAIKEFGGAHPSKLQSFCSEVFEKKDDGWKVLHFRSSWEPAPASAK